MRKFYAHSLDGMPVDKWHLLDEHLKRTAELANHSRQNSDVGNGEGWRVCGMIFLPTIKSHFIRREVYKWKTRT
jgi:hypothetical protein